MTGGDSEATSVEIERDLGGLRTCIQSEWRVRFPWLVQGTTLRRDDLDFGSRLPGDGQADVDALRRRRRAAWELLQRATGIREIARCSQVHGAGVARCEEPGLDGVNVLAEADALVTRRLGVLLAVTVADCIPVFMVDPKRRVLGLAHAGWRGAAAGVVEAALASMSEFGAELDELCVHLGPAICGDCYEVGPEVAAALGRPSAGTTRVDLREVVATALAAAGIDPARLTVSDACTLHDSAAFYSYRGNDQVQRMCAFLGLAAG